MSSQHRAESLLDAGLGGARDTTDLERRVLMLIDKKRRQVRRIRWAVGIAWAVLVAVCIAGGIVESSEADRLVSTGFAWFARALLLIALVLTVSWYVRSVSLRFDIVQQALSIIQDRLEKHSRESGPPAC
jgi:membrane protein YdbS with pleckstrin-like domain